MMIILFYFILATTITAHAAETNILNERIPSFSAPWGAEFRHLCAELKRPCGIYAIVDDYSVLDSDDEKPGLELENATVREILREITRRHPRYRWQLDGRVLNLKPRKKADRRVAGRDPLELVVPDFEAKDMSSATAMMTACQRTGLVFGLREIVGRLHAYEKINARVGKTSLQKTLNSIAALDGQAMWILQLDKNGQIYFDVRTWRPSPLR